MAIMPNIENSLLISVKAISHVIRVNSKVHIISPSSVEMALYKIHTHLAFQSGIALNR